MRTEWLAESIGRWRREERGRTRCDERLATVGSCVDVETVLEIGACGGAILRASLAIGEQSLNVLDERTCSATMPGSFGSALKAFARLAMGNRTSRSPEGCHEGHSGGPRFTACLMACVFQTL